MRNILYFYDDRFNGQTVLVTRTGQIMTSSLTPKALLQKACRDYGGSYAGARESFAYLTGAKHKIPIVVSLVFRLIFIPVYGEENERSLYLQYDRIERVRRKGKSCEIRFKGGVTLTIAACDPRRILRQMKRCSDFLDCVQEPDCLGIKKREEYTNAKTVDPVGSADPFGRRSGFVVSAGSKKRSADAANEPPSGRKSDAEGAGG